MIYQVIRKKNSNQFLILAWGDQDSVSNNSTTQNSTLQNSNFLLATTLSTSLSKSKENLVQDSTKDFKQSHSQSNKKKIKKSRNRIHRSSLSRNKIHRSSLSSPPIHPKIEIHSCEENDHEKEDFIQTIDESNLSVV